MVRGFVDRGARLLISAIDGGSGMLPGVGLLVAKPAAAGQNERAEERAGD